jgi:hypothetical protein
MKKKLYQSSGGFRKKTQALDLSRYSSSTAILLVKKKADD